MLDICVNACRSGEQVHAHEGHTHARAGRPDVSIVAVFLVRCAQGGLRECVRVCVCVCIESTRVMRVYVDDVLCSCICVRVYVCVSVCVRTSDVCASSKEQSM